eukprot:s128_g43.t2
MIRIPARTLEPRHLLPLAAQAVPGLLALLEDSSQQTAAVECLSTLAAALGADAPHLEAVLQKKILSHSEEPFVMNGGLIVGTMGGANIEIREECGEDTMFIFGCLEHEVPSVIQAAQCGHYPIDGRLQEVFEAIRCGKFSEGEPDAQAEFNSMLDRTTSSVSQASQAALLSGTWDGDRYLVIHDFPSFVDAQAKVDATYKDKATWCRLSIQAASSMAKFSTDCTIAEYADVIWGVKPARRELEPAVVGSVPVPKPKAECILKVDAIPEAARRFETGHDISGCQGRTQASEGEGAGVRCRGRWQRQLRPFAGVASPEFAQRVRSEGWRLETTCKYAAWTAWQEAQAKKHGHTDHEVIKLADGEGFVIDGDKAYPIV